jgi:hypothetical protein
LIATPSSTSLFALTGALPVATPSQTPNKAAPAYVDAPSQTLGTAHSQHPSIAVPSIPATALPVPPLPQSAQLGGTHTIPATVKGKQIAQPMPMQPHKLRRSSHKNKKASMFPSLVATPIKPRALSCFLSNKSCTLRAKRPVGMYRTLEERQERN